tara:strand:- start:917 stop:1753 length:837 start_codon:yes stop_codon:yes gene_type:complete
MPLDWKIFTQRPYIKSLSLEEQMRLFSIANEKSIKLRESSFKDFANSNSTSQGAAGGEQKSSPSFTNIYSLNFDGNDDIVDTPSIDLGLENTISFWAKRNTGTNFNGMVWGGVAQSNYYVIYLNTSNRLQYRVGSGAETFTDSDIISAISSNDWFHCALVRNNSGADVLCYINGELKQTKTNIVGSGDNTILQKIGGRSLDDFEIEGNLDEMAVWPTALNESDIISIYNEGTPNDISSLSPLSWYRFEEGSGTTATDSGTAGNTGTITGATYEENVPV